LIKGLILNGQGRLGVCQRLLELAYDARRFILYNRSIIEIAPLQIYSAALLFTPETSLVRKQYLKRIPWILMEPKVEQKWSPLIQSFEGHSKWVQAIVFSPDGKLVASTSYDNTVRLWDTATGESCGVLKGHSNRVRALAFSPDGKQIASASDDETVRLWDPATGESCGILEGHSALVKALAFSPDGKLVASASDDKTVRIWDLATGGSCGVLEGHSALVSAVVFSPDGKLVASASNDRTVRLWDPATRGSCGVLGRHSRDVNAVVFSPDGKLVASSSADKTVRLWDVTQTTIIQKIHTRGQIKDLAFSDVTTLDTGRGILTVTSHPYPSNTTWEVLPPPLHVIGEWVIWDRKKVLFLPWDYRPCSYAVKDNILVMGHQSGHVSFMRFDPTALALHFSLSPTQHSPFVRGKNCR